MIARIILGVGLRGVRISSLVKSLPRMITGKRVKLCYDKLSEYRISRGWQCINTYHAYVMNTPGSKDVADVDWASILYKGEHQYFQCNLVSILIKQITDIIYQSIWTCLFNISGMYIVYHPLFAHDMLQRMGSLYNIARCASYSIALLMRGLFTSMGSRFCSSSHEMHNQSGLIMLT